MALISVIVPIYNVAKYLNRCVESLINQTFKDIEIILVDDGSEDNSGKLCDEWAEKDSRIKVIHKENGGLSSARNAGLDYICNKEIKPEYITFTDSDDTVDLNLYSFFVYNSKNINPDIFIFEAKKVYENSIAKPVNTQKFSVQTIDYDKIWEIVFSRLNNSSCNKIYKYNLIKDLRFPFGIIHGEDLIFNLDYIIRCKNGVYTHAPFYNYYIRKNSITHQKLNNHSFDEIEIKDLAKKFVFKNKPEYYAIAETYCFRARMNLLRKIYLTKKQNEYETEISNMKKYVTENYYNVSSVLKYKEKIEYFLLKNNIFFYYIINLILNKEN